MLAHFQPMPDPRLDQTSRKKFSQRTRPYCPTKKSKPFIPDIFIPSTNDSTSKFSPAKSAPLRDTLEIPVTSGICEQPIDLILPNFTHDTQLEPYLTPLQELNHILEDIKTSYNQQPVHYGPTPITLCNQEYTMESLFGPSTPCQDERVIPGIDTEPEPSIETNEEPKMPSLRDMNFSDYHEILNIMPTNEPRIAPPPTPTRRPTCLVIGYPIDIQNSDQLALLRDPEIDLERLFNSLN